MNVAKVQSAKVVRYDDYVFYVMLGGYNDENPDATEEENVKFAAGSDSAGSGHHRILLRKINTKNIEKDGVCRPFLLLRQYLR